MLCYSGETANIVWQTAMKELLSSKEGCLDSRLGEMREKANVSFEITNPRQRWVFSRTPAMNPAFAIAETFAILGGINDSAFLNFWNPALPKYAGHTDTYYGAYGFRLRKHFHFDQIERAYLSLKNNPTSRQAVLQIWDPSSDLPNENGSPKAADIPCNISSLLKIRNGKLQWMQIMRGNDLYRGTPYNLIQFTTLQEIIAGWLNIEVGTYHQITDSLHLYINDLNEIDKGASLSPSPNLLNSDKLGLPKNQWEEVFIECLNIIKSFSNKNLSKNNFLEIIKNLKLPSSYTNLICIAAADCARRRNWKNEVEIPLAICTNNLLIELWTNWKNRNASKTP